MYSFSMAVKRLLDLLTFADFRKPKRFGIFRHLYQYESDNENFHIMANMVLTGIASIWLVKYHGDKIIIGTDGVPRFRLKKSKK